jgi:hypothetical protein
VACRRADGDGAAADYPGIKLPLVEAAPPMPVCVISDLIMGEVGPAQACRRSAAAALKAFPGLAGGLASSTAAANGYILGVIGGTAPFTSFRLSKSSCASPTKSYPGH